MVQLVNTIYIPTFHTSVVSLSRMISKGIHWKTELRALFYGNAYFAAITEKHNQFVLEYNHQSVFTANSRNLRSESITSTALWHQHMGYTSYDALCHIWSSTTGASLNNGGAPPRDVCKPYCINKATVVSSRHPSNWALMPYQRVHVDV
jgi:hypothetical protein